MTIATCQHCDEQIYWFGRHSRWLHATSHSRYCGTPGMTAQAEPVRGTVAEEPDHQQIPA
jgi:hypothetical protein